MTEPLNLKELAERWSIVRVHRTDCCEDASPPVQQAINAAADIHSLLGALRETRTALLWAKALHDRQSYVDGPNWANCAELMRTTLGSVVDD